MTDDKSQEELSTTILGHPLAIKGVNMLIVVVLAGALGGIIYLVIHNVSAEHMQQSDHGSSEHEQLVDTLKEINKTNARNGELLEEQNYMVLSDEKERKAMKDKLRRPSSLSKKLKWESD